ncbi:MAG TPA: EAL domain-containing protein [Acidiferrobacterales bacterium]|nr:EAL domain-containing protein [Acidiferrobacterales bacterium]
MLTARDALCPWLARVTADQHPSASATETAVYAVFAPDDEPTQTGGGFLGLVTRHQVAPYPERIFADLLPRSVPTPATADTPVDDLIVRLDRENIEAITVEEHGAFLGAVTRSSLLSALLHGELAQFQPDAGAAVQTAGLHEAALRLLELLTSEEVETELLQQSIEILTALLKTRYGAIGIVDEQGGLTHFVHTGIPPELAARIGQLPQGRGLLGVMIHENHALRLDDMSRDQRSAGFPKHHPPMKSLLAVPISHEGKVYGRLYFSDKLDAAPFSPEDERLAARSAGAVALTLAHHRLQRERHQVEEMLHDIAQALSAATGERFFRELVLNLTKALGTDYSFVGKISAGNPELVQTVAACGHGRILPNFDYLLCGTPCNNVVGNQACHYLAGVQKLFPDDRNLVEMGIEAYFGHPLFDAAGQALGLLVVMHTRPIVKSESLDSILRICSVRAAAELERIRSEAERRKLASAVEQTADSVVITDPDGVIEYVNPAFEQATGYQRAEVLGGKSSMLKSGQHDQGFYQRLWATIKRGEPFREVFINRRKNGTFYYEEKTITPLTDENGRITQFVSTGKDISARMYAEQEARQMQYFLNAVVENLPNILFVKDAKDLRFVRFNKAAEELLGHPRAEMLGKSDYDFFPKAEADFITAMDREVLNTGELMDIPFESVQTRHQGERWMHTRKIPIFDESGQPQYLLGISEDITERRQTEDRAARLGRILERSSNEIYVFDAATLKFTQVNQGALKNLGYTLDELRGLTAVDLKPAFTPAQFRELIEPLRRGDVETLSFETDHRRKDGSLYPVEVHLQFSSVETPPVFVAVISDITERQQAQERLNYLAFYDTLTGLPNRLLLLDRIRQTTLESRRHERLVAILYLDLDRFKLVNDTLGHDAGDQLLKDVAGRLTGCVRPGDTVARLGGDEFTVVLANVAHVDDVGRVAQKVIDAFAQPFQLAGQELFMSPSIGITLYPFDDTDPGALLKNADAAMYHAKDSGRNTFRFFTADLNTRAARRLDLETALRYALEREEFVLHYQPQVDLTSGRIIGLEALVRWQRPGTGLVSPLDFIPLAEETGLIVPIGEWVLRTACAQNKAWQEAGLPALNMSVNVAARQFQQQDLAEIVARVLQDTGLDARWLTLEITESTVMRDAGAAITALQEIGSLGVGLSVDDFGTGYSSLSYLKRFPLNCLKIDKSFIDDITTDPDDAAITTAIISMAGSLEIMVVAEGVETLAQLNFLRARGCDAMQGYYFSKPLPAAAFATLLAGGKCLETDSVTAPPRDVKKSSARPKRPALQRKAPAKK